MTPKQLVDGLNRLVSLPEVCVKVNRLVETANSDAYQIGQVIAQDTALTARLLRLVNCSFFAFRSKIDTVSRAVAVLGTTELRNLVMAVSAARLFTGIPSDLVDMNQFWRHSVLTGLIAQSLAKRGNVLHSERLFVMGVLHDIGRLVIYLELPEAARDILLITGGDDMLLPQAECDVLGFTHMQVGAELLHKWSMPEGLKAVVGNHHDPDNAQDYLLETALLHMAIVIANGEMLGSSLDELLDDIPLSVWALTQLGRDDISEVVDEMHNGMTEVAEIILSPVSSSRNH